MIDFSVKRAGTGNIKTGWIKKSDKDKCST
jgi:hypothetical protein